MKKTPLLMVLAILMFSSNLFIIKASDSKPITIINAITITAEKNQNTESNKDHTVTIKGLIKNNTDSTIVDLKIYLDVKTKWLGLKDTITIVNLTPIDANATYIINITKDLAEKYAEIENISIKINGGESITIYNPGTEPRNSTGSGLNFDTPDPWIATGFLGVFAVLFIIATLINKRGKR